MSNRQVFSSIEANALLKEFGSIEINSGLLGDACKFVQYTLKPGFIRSFPDVVNDLTWGTAVVEACWYACLHRLHCPSASAREIFRSYGFPVEELGEQQ